MSSLHPEAEALSALSTRAEGPDDGPVVMLNLLRFRAQAAYPEGSAHAACSGREAYQRYASSVGAHLRVVGGKPVFMGAVEQTLIGPADESWDEALLVEYPSRASFLRMVADPDYLACTVHRTAALLDSRLIVTSPAARRPPAA